MRRLTDPERETAARLYPEAVRHSAPAMRRRPDIADEIESGAGLAAMRSARMPDPAGSLPRIARLMARDAAYRTRPSFRRHPAPDRPGGLPDALPAPAEPDGRPDVAAALRTLPPRQYQAVELAILRGLGRSEAARIMEIALKNVRKHLGKALSTLRTQLRETA